MNGTVALALTGLLLCSGWVAAAAAVGQNDIHLAATYGNVDAVRQLVLAKPLIHRNRDQDGNTPLHVATLRGHLGVVRLLLESGADVNAKVGAGDKPYGVTSLHLGSDPSIIEELLRCQPDLTVRDSPGGDTPLQHAASEVALARVTGRDSDVRTWQQIATLLLDAGAYYDIFSAIYLDDTPRVRSIVLENPERAQGRDGFRSVPLRVAAAEGRLKICRILLENGADPNDYRFGSSPWHHSAGGPIPIICETMQHPQIVRLLLDAGAICTRPVEVRGGATGILPVSFESATTMHYAAAAGVTASAQLIFARGVDIDAADADGLTPLHVAVKWGHQGMAEFLLKNGANPSVRDRKGRTPLDMAKHTNGARELSDLLHRALNQPIHNSCP